MGRDQGFGFKKLDVYQAALKHFAWSTEAVGRVRLLPFRVRDQVLSASLSVLSNIGEANGREKRPRETEQHYRYALGSTFECATHLDALHVLGALSDEEHAKRDRDLAAIAAMLSGLMRRHRKRSASR